jgi:hypothetical protein
MSSVQLRELATHMAATNIYLTERPKFLTGVAVLTGTQDITAEAPSEIRLEPWKIKILGQLMRHICGSAVPEFGGKPQVLEDIKSGRV